MSPRQPIVTWQILEEDAAWEALQESLLADSQRPHDRPSRLRRWLAGLAILLSMAALVIGLHLYHEGRQGLELVEADIQHTMELEAQTWQPPDAAPGVNPAGGQLPQPRPQPGPNSSYAGSVRVPGSLPVQKPATPLVAMRNMELQGKTALVEVVMASSRQPWLTVPYRQTRFYRETPGGWLSTAPREELWGPALEAESEHFHFLFHRRDAPAVAPAMVEVEQRYAELRRRLGLGPSPATEKLTIDVVAELGSRNLEALRFQGSRLAVPSPALLEVPDAIPAGTALAWTIQAPLVAHALDDAYRQFGVECIFQRLGDGLRLWLTWDSNPMPSPRRYILEDGLRNWLREDLSPLQLADLTATRDTYCAVPPLMAAEQTWPPYPIAAETVIEYAVDTYGRKQLPALVKGLGQYDAWSELVQAVFGVPAHEFEAGWQRYLSERYGSVSP